MADLLALRATVRGLNAQLDAAQQELDNLESEADDPDLPPAARAGIRREIIAQNRVVQRLTTERDAAQAAYQAAAQADPVHSVDAGLPLVLFPVRIETAYLPGASGTDLVVRIYPDEIHVDAHEAELTDAELASGTAYWQAVWGAGPNRSRLDIAWSALLGQLKPGRAAWVVQALTPAVPRPTIETPPDQPQPVPPLPSVAIRPGTFNRAARTDLLPDHWTFIGMRNGAELFYVDGPAISSPVDVSFGPPGTGGESSDLPFDAGSRWLVDLDAAIAAGMAVRIPLTGTDLSVDQLFVLGVSSQAAPADAASRLESALVAHQYTNGVAFLPAGSPTNNTTRTRSAWQSAPTPMAPADIEAARAAYQAESLQNAAVVAQALGIDGSAVLAIVPHGLDDQQTPVVAVGQQLWPALGGKALALLYWRWDVPAGQSPSQGGWQLHNDPPTVAALTDHFNGWVRSRGTLPVVRIGNQPYGLLPASSLADWATPADDPTTPLVEWLRVFRPYWLAAVQNTPRVVVGDANPDATVVNVLNRLPVSTEIMVRSDGDPVAQSVSNAPFPVAPIPGLPMTSELFYAAPSDVAVSMPIPVVGQADPDHQLMLLWRDLFSDSTAVLEQTMPWQTWVNRYQSLFGVGTPPTAPPPDLFTTLVQDSFTDPFALSPNSSVIAGIIFGALTYNQNKDDPNFQQQVQQLLPQANAFLAQFQTFCAVDSGLYDEVLRELLDVLSHRYDAWVTSLAARRLSQLRATKPTGVAIGGYGFVENLAPRSDLTPVNPPPAGFDNAFSSPDQRYIHAPSLHHAATAAVLRAGYDSHHDSGALAVNLVSSRVRVADWLANGVRNGQPVGALLGYRFERGLHDAGLDGLIEQLRKDHPLPLPTGTDADANGPGARDAIAARNVVDGLDLYRNRDSVRAQYADQPQVGVLLDDLVNSIDALGDLLLAESVHHLVGGNPLRAGLAADTIGRGEPVPDRFDVVRTPRSGRPLTWQVGALLPAAWQATATGWSTDRPRAVLEPHVNAWAATMLGDAGRWQIACTVTSGGGDESMAAVGLDSLGLAALDVICEAAGNPSQLEQRIVDAVAASQTSGTTVTVVRTPAADGSLGYAELDGLAARIRALLAKASPLGPPHVEGPNASPALGFDTGELASRVAVFQTSFAAAVAQLKTAAAGPAAGARTALIAVADHGIASAYPAAGPDASVIAQASAVLAAVTPLAGTNPPAPPASGAAPSDVLTWFGAVTDYVQSIAGRAVPVVPAYALPVTSAYAASFAPGAAPSGADEPAVMAWLRRIARVRPNTAALHDVLLASETLGGAPPGLTAAQLPVDSGALWAGLPFDSAPPKARLATVVSTPAPIDPSVEFCGLAFDNWTELVPGLTTVADRAKGYEPAEVTGIAFSVDTPDAYPPQAVLLAIAPDQSWGWSLDMLFDVVSETLELAKIRGVDLGDLPRLGRVLPALHSGSNLDNVFRAAGMTQ